MITLKDEYVGKSLLTDILASFKKGEKRNFLNDAKRFVLENNVKFEAKFLSKTYPQTPSLIAINHYIRPLMARMSVFTTIDSMATSAIVTIAFSKAQSKKTVWAVKYNLLKNILFYDLKIRKAQIASVFTYDAIGVLKNYPFGAKQEWVKHIKKGFNIAFYPEGRTSTVLKSAQSGAGQIFRSLMNEKAGFQLIAVSISFENGIYKAIFSKPLKLPKNPEAIMDVAMVEIAKNLPRNLRGKWQRKIK